MRWIVGRCRGLDVASMSLSDCVRSMRSGSRVSEVLLDASTGAGMRSSVAVDDLGIRYIVEFDVGELVAFCDVSRKNAVIPRSEPGSPR